MKEQLFNEIVEEILTAQMTPKEIPKITNSFNSDLTISEAYEIQTAVLTARINQGEKIAGIKMGLTSKAKLKQMKVEQPVHGFILDSMLVEDGNKILLKDYLHPKAEAEIGFVLKKDLSINDATIEQVLAATDYIFPALEIIDSRYQNFSFTIPDVIADNTSAAGVVYGNHSQKLNKQDLETIGVVLEVNGEVRETGAGAAVLEHPAAAIVELIKLLAKKNQVLKAGQPILTGGITAAVSLNTGDYVEASFGEGLGSVRLLVK